MSLLNQIVNEILEQSETSINDCELYNKLKVSIALYGSLIALIGVQALGKNDFLIVLNQMLHKKNDLGDDAEHATEIIEALIGIVKTYN